MISNEFNSGDFEDYSFDDNGYEMQSEGAMLKAIGFAIIGSIPGITLWIILSQSGYLSAISGALISAGIIFGYSRLGGRDPRSTTIEKGICILIMIIAIYIGIRLSMIMAIQSMINSFNVYERTRFLELNHISNNVTLSECNRVFSSALKYPLFKSLYHGTLLAGYLFGLIGGLSVLFSKSGKFGFLIKPRYLNPNMPNIIKESEERERSMNLQINARREIIEEEKRRNEELLQRRRETYVWQSNSGMDDLSSDGQTGVKEEKEKTYMDSI